MHIPHDSASPPGPGIPSPASKLYLPGDRCNYGSGMLADSATNYLRAQWHSIVWVDLEQKSIKKHIECKPGINSNLYQNYLDEEQSDT